ncbi:hypothetical protein EVAR_7635_1 [Eumeta japonica]|uniref:Uncharacterized protein n=1 Tax=Eumeta variegata TaxID=151549 RepID=A0A4C1TJ32_EUMVA|nr:hypothetical protein EVAR_7635_1 [Eumeta japonica]
MPRTQNNEDAGSDSIASPGTSNEVCRLTTKIPPFWPEEPIIWFAQVEDSKERKLKQLLHEELGDRKPSQFLRHLQGLAGPTSPMTYSSQYGQAAYHKNIVRVKRRCHDISFLSNFIILHSVATHGVRIRHIKYPYGYQYGYPYGYQVSIWISSMDIHIDIKYPYGYQYGYPYRYQVSIWISVWISIWISVWISISISSIHMDISMDIHIDINPYGYQYGYPYRYQVSIWISGGYPYRYQSIWISVWISISISSIHMDISMDIHIDIKYPYGYQYGYPYRYQVSIWKSVWISISISSIHMDIKENADSHIHQGVKNVKTTNRCAPDHLT